MWKIQHVTNGNRKVNKKGMNTEVMFSSKTNEWATPLDLFKRLDDEFHFDLDPCSTEENHKCERYFTKADNGLLQNWGVQSFL